jgi:hypothetical protein
MVVKKAVRLSIVQGASLAGYRGRDSRLPLFGSLACTFLADEPRDGCRVLAVAEDEVQALVAHEADVVESDVG